MAPGRLDGQTMPAQLGRGRSRGRALAAASRNPAAGGPTWDCGAPAFRQLSAAMELPCH